MYYNVNIEARSRNHCYRGKPVSIKHYECVFVFLPYLAGMQIAFICAILYIYSHLWPVWLYHIYPHQITNGTIFGGKKNTGHKM